MKPTKETERRDSDRRNPPSERRQDVARAVSGERRVVEQRGMCEAMVDALEDILKWERASERTIRAAAEANNGGAASN